MVVAKTLYVTKRARPDTSLAIVFLIKVSRVSLSDDDDFQRYV
jgi:hypothetical protein